MQLLIPGYYFSLSSLAVGTDLAFLFFPITFHNAFRLYEEGKSSSGSGPWCSSQSVLTLELYYSVLWPSIPVMAPKSCSNYVGGIFLPSETLSHGLQWPMSWSPLYVQLRRLVSSLLVSFPLWTSYFFSHQPLSCSKAFRYSFACMVIQSRSLHMAYTLSPLSHVFLQKPSLTTLRNSTFSSIPFSFLVLIINSNHILCPPK